jgi:hypothetical protein
MTSFYIEPENKFFLASLSSDPLIQEVEIERIGVDPEARMWTFVLKGQPKGEQTLWDRLSQAVKELHPEVAEVRFEWTGPAQEPRQEERTRTRRCLSGECN